MFAIIFLAFGVWFSWLVYQAISTREIVARGWGFNTRIYSRDNEPVWYWVTFTSYSICAVWATTFAILLVQKSLF
ncbi:hypothetical protein [Candidatus Aalborgicola defluviihabitans]|jgi:hypothetical protein|uniref:hypothetical protein n=1 Tax=Candidatus Aalborgicola defluviihabitans TaxID=3386187 RepID=UPI001D9E6DF4|nr:hypothetical protein [Burkholderiales bacterium]MBK6569475.1 hypothetical protein [Burkholderiales bacterium]MBK7280894.1 hypothetical protein [Burkholderiales bacterium]MBK7315830.1 hypothetical protein [Burkholderiales bacterium]MBL0243255.1 hypothetical protein [Rhodoferax sp.]